MSATPHAGAARNITVWTLDDLVEWDRRIRDKAAEFGLSDFPFTKTISAIIIPSLRRAESPMQWSSASWTRRVPWIQ